MKIPFLYKTIKKGTLPEIDLLDIMKLDNNMPADNMFRIIRHLLNYFKTAQATKVWTSQILVEMLYQVSKNTNFDDSTKNRYMLMTLQELKYIQRSRQSDELLIISGLSFKNFMLQKLQLKSVYFVGCEFDDTDLSESTFRNCEFRGCSFKSADLSKAIFLKVKIIGCNFDSAITDGARGL